MAPLSPDETYYWVWSRTLQPGYLDHPPMVALWIRIGTALAGETALGVRLLGPLAGLAGTALLADAAERLFPGRRAGIKAALLLNATLMMGAGVVTMTPDTPLLFFAVLTLWALVRAEDDARWWLMAGVAIGLALDSKYTAVLLALAPVLHIVVTRRWGWLRSPWPWAAAALAVILFLPVVLWNAEVGWASFAKQGGRAGDWRPADALRFVGELLGAQAGLATPPVFVLFAIGLWRVGRRALRDKAAALVAVLAIPGLLLFSEHALGDRVQPNWLAILYPPLAVAAASASWRWVRVSAWVGFVLTAVVYVQAAAAPIPLPRRLDPTLIRLAGWDGVARDADQVRAAENLAFLASEDYSVAAELAWWAPPGTRVLGVEPRWRLFRLRRGLRETGVLLVSDRRHEEPDPARWRDVTPLGHIARARGGVEAEGFRVYRVTLRTGAPSALLPRRGDK